MAFTGELHQPGGLLAWPLQTKRTPVTALPWCFLFLAGWLQDSPLAFSPVDPGRYEGSPTPVGRGFFRWLENSSALPWPTVCWSVVSTAFMPSGRSAARCWPLSMDPGKCGDALAQASDERMLLRSIGQGRLRDDRLLWNRGKASPPMVLYTGANLFMNSWALSSAFILFSIAHGQLIALLDYGWVCIRKNP